MDPAELVRLGQGRRSVRTRPGEPLPGPAMTLGDLQALRPASDTMEVDRRKRAEASQPVPVNHAKSAARLTLSQIIAATLGRVAVSLAVGWCRDEARGYVELDEVWIAVCHWSIPGAAGNRERQPIVRRGERDLSGADLLR